SPGESGSLGNAKALVIDTTAPIVSAVTTSTAAGSYKAAGTVAITVTFSEAVTSTGTSSLLLETGSTDTAATCAAVTASTTLSCTYTVVAGDTTSHLDYQSTSALTGTIADAAGNSATLTLPALQSSALYTGQTIIIDTTAPVVSGVTSTLGDGSYKVGQVVPVTVTFSEAVTVTGTPQLALKTGASATTPVNYVSGSGTTVLTFTYTVANGDTSVDLDYVGTTSLGLNGGTIADAAGNSATLTLASPGESGSLGNAKALVIDTTAPTVALTYSPNRAVKSGDSVTVTATFSEAMASSPTIAIAVPSGGTNAVTVTAMTGTSSSVWTYAYTVGTGNGTATVTIAGTDVALNASASATNATFTVDNTAPVVALTYSIASSVPANAAAAAALTYSASASRPVKVGDIVVVKAVTTE
ncbi:MAG: adhesin, partial [Proteobacteria bacterium]|nr:adhesin [Pseudomonadota bacterium]